MIVHKLHILFAFFSFACQLLPSTAAAGNKNKKHHQGSAYHADYIVIGVGAAGSVVAKRLTDDMKTSVLALEAGKNHNTDPDIQLSINAPLVGYENNPEYFWPGNTIGEPALNARDTDWTTGRLLGGESSINALFYCRGTNQLYDSWEQIAGPRWSAENMLTIAKSMEKFDGIPGFFNPSAHNRSGLLDIRQAPAKPTLLAVSLSGALAAAANVPFLIDYNDPATPIGVSPYIQYFQSGFQGQYRVSTATAFLNDTVVRANGIGVAKRQLLLLTSSTALRVLWNKNTASGVEFLKDGMTIKAYAKKGVILCSGINSCTLLQQSGIGPKELLALYKIPLKFDNPNVGMQVKEHANMVVLFEKPAHVMTKPSNDPNAYAQMVAWLPDPAADADKNTRAIEIITYDFLPNTLAMSIIPLKPQSSGIVQIQSSDPQQPPQSTLDIFSEPADMDLMVRAFKSYVQPAMNYLISQGFLPVGLSDEIIDDTVQLKQFIRNQINLYGGIHNYMGMARMAPLNQGGVVDEYGRVYGVNSLFVADNSIGPDIMDGATTSSALIIGYNIAQGILELQR